MLEEVTKKWTATTRGGYKGGGGISPEPWLMGAALL